MDAKLKRLGFLGITVLCGGGVVTWETPQNLLLFVLWVTAIVFAVRRSILSLGNKPAVLLGGLHAFVMVVIITAGVLAPVKRIDALLQRTVDLDKDTMSVAELAEYCEHNRSTLPVSVYLAPDDANARPILHFSNKVLSLQQFITEVERQTGCEHHFSGCGNAYSVLHGKAYNFGLSFVPKPNSRNE